LGDPEIANKMKAISLLLLTIILFIVSGCSGSITGIVVDAETGQPIAGAVVLVEWTMTSGKWIGLRSTSSYKVVETITDNAGKFKVRGVSNPLVNPPHLTIYKKGYVAWNNEFIFPDYRKRDENDYRSLAPNIVISMERFNEKKYKYSDHTLFIHGSINAGLPGSEKKLIGQAIRWEDLKAEEEILKHK